MLNGRQMSSGIQKNVTTCPGLPYILNIVSVRFTIEHSGVFCSFNIQAWNSRTSMPLFSVSIFLHLVMYFLRSLLVSCQYVNFPCETLKTFLNHSPSTKIIFKNLDDIMTAMLSMYRIQKCAKWGCFVRLYCYFQLFYYAWSEYYLSLLKKTVVCDLLSFKSRVQRNLVQCFHGQETFFISRKCEESVIDFRLCSLSLSDNIET